MHPGLLLNELPLYSSSSLVDHRERPNLACLIYVLMEIVEKSDATLMHLPTVALGQRLECIPPSQKSTCLLEDTTRTSSCFKASF
jgi:hypothetical protein